MKKQQTKQTRIVRWKITNWPIILDWMFNGSTGENEQVAKETNHNIPLHGFGVRTSFATGAVSAFDFE